MDTSLKTVLAIITFIVRCCMMCVNLRLIADSSALILHEKQYNALDYHEKHKLHRVYSGAGALRNGEGLLLRLRLAYHEGQIHPL